MTDLFTNPGGELRVDIAEHPDGDASAPDTALPSEFAGGWSFAPLPMFGFDLIVCDPPTEFTLRSEKGAEKSAAAHYKLMSWEDLERLPVGHLARANAVLLLWACAPTLPKSLRLMHAWGATYKTELVWRKITENAKVRMGPGYRARTMHESVLVGVFGDERQIHTPFPSLFDGVAREHSRKPDEFYSMVLKHTPGLTRCDLFARQTHEGFEKWGNEADKFDSPADHSGVLHTGESTVLAAG